MEEFEPRIPDWMAGLMIGTAIFFSALQWLLAFIFMGWLVAIYAYLTFFVWYKIRGVMFLERAGAKIASWVVGFIISVFSNGIVPGIIFSVFATIALVKFEDKLVESGVVTKEELSKLNVFVVGLAKKHGIESPEFRHALAQALGREIVNRAKDKIDKKLPKLHI